MSYNQNESSALNALKLACIKKNFVSFKEINSGEYIVEKFTVVDTSHGKRVRIDLRDSYMYLPERFVGALTEPVLAELNKSPKVMVYGGKDSSNRDRLILDFREYSYFAELLTDFPLEDNM